MTRKPPVPKKPPGLGQGKIANEQDSKCKPFNRSNSDADGVDTCTGSDQPVLEPLLVCPEPTSTLHPVTEDSCCGAKAGDTWSLSTTPPGPSTPSLDSRQMQSSGEMLPDDESNKEKTKMNIFGFWKAKQKDGKTKPPETLPKPVKPVRSKTDNPGKVRGRQPSVEEAPEVLTKRKHNRDELHAWALSFQKQISVLKQCIEACEADVPLLADFFSQYLTTLAEAAAWCTTFIAQFDLVINNWDARPTYVELIDRMIPETPFPKYECDICSRENSHDDNTEQAQTGDNPMSFCAFNITITVEHKRRLDFEALTDPSIPAAIQRTLDDINGRTMSASTPPTAAALANGGMQQMKLYQPSEVVTFNAVLVQLQNLLETYSKKHCRDIEATQAVANLERIKMVLRVQNIRTAHLENEIWWSKNQRDIEKMNQNLSGDLRKNWQEARTGTLKYHEVVFKRNRRGDRQQVELLLFSHHLVRLDLQRVVKFVEDISKIKASISEGNCISIIGHYSYTVTFPNDTAAHSWAKEIESVQMHIQSDTNNPMLGRPWMEDDGASCCLICAAQFTAVYRKHHCRCCGFLVCTSCHEEFKMRLVYRGRAGMNPVCLICFCVEMIHRAASILNTKDEDLSERFPNEINILQSKETLSACFDDILEDKSGKTNPRAPEGDLVNGCSRPASTVENEGKASVSTEDIQSMSRTGSIRKKNRDGKSLAPQPDEIETSCVSVLLGRDLEAKKGKVFLFFKFILILCPGAAAEATSDGEKSRLKVWLMMSANAQELVIRRARTLHLSFTVQKNLMRKKPIKTRNTVERELVNDKVWLAEHKIEDVQPVSWYNLATRKWEDKFAQVLPSMDTAVNASNLVIMRAKWDVWADPEYLLNTRSQYVTEGQGEDGIVSSLKELARTQNLRWSTESDTSTHKSTQRKSRPNQPQKWSSNWNYVILLNIDMLAVLLEEKARGFSMTDALNTVFNGNNPQPHDQFCCFRVRTDKTSTLDIHMMLSHTLIDMKKLLIPNDATSPEMSSSSP